ncbi:MAG: cytochrome c [Colwellia sp.]|nr:cytochrome c [Colwellia sp.]
MFTVNNNVLAFLLLLLIGLSAQLQASDNTIQVNKAEQGSLKSVMQGLLTATQALTAAVLTEDFVMIEKAAKNIADHPKPSMATRMKLMKAMAADMTKFKANDDVVHHAAVNMVKNAQQQNIKLITDDFQKMIGGCIACHSEFKSKVSVILK